jgi:hypothetical protein
MTTFAGSLYKLNKCRKDTKEDVSPDSKTIKQTANETFANPEKCYGKAMFWAIYEDF